MKLKLFAPGKTFLAGEYAVLKNGPALILNTGPRFEFLAAKGQGRIAGIPAGSPAFRFLRENADVCAGWDVEFHDPHSGRGGFGASGAQFLCAHSFVRLARERVESDIDLTQVLTDFKRLGEGSGSDILSQAVGMVARIENGHARAEAWPFKDLNFAILRTGKKVATHEHLRGIDSIQLEGFIPLAERVCEMFLNANESGFLKALADYSENLSGCGLQAEETLRLTTEARKQPWCLLAKGCGALGADTILLLYRHSDLGAVEKFAAVQGLPFAGRREDLDEGLKVEWDL